MIRFESNGKKYALYFDHIKEFVSRATFRGDRRCSKAILFEDKGLGRDNPPVTAGTAVCNEADNFCRGVGRQLALWNALETLVCDREFRQTVWDAYRSECKDSRDVYTTVNNIRNGCYQSNHNQKVIEKLSSSAKKITIK